MREITYSQAINEALCQTIKKDPSVLVMGQGVKSVWYVGNTCQGLLEKFGEKRIIDTPVSENAVTGAGVGAALAGMRPIVIHPRMDFMLYALDSIINQAGNWSYMSGGKVSVPLVIWAIINRGGEQAAQHSQALQALFSHIPGLKVVMPSNPYDAKGLLISSIYDNNPVIFIDDRWLYNVKGQVPEEIYKVPIGKASVLKEGNDITVISNSYMVQEAIKASQELKADNIDIELIDLRTIKPLDKNLIINSAKKTGRLAIIDGGWKSFGVSAEISALVSEAPIRLKSPIKRICLPDIPAPASRTLEKAYYINKNDIIKAIKSLF